MNAADLASMLAVPLPLGHLRAAAVFPGDEEGGSTAALPIVAYTVAPGDTLSSIAERFHTSVASLEASNGLGDNSILHPGDKLQVPTQIGWIYTVAQGDTLGSIASRAGVTVDALAQANHLPLDATLQIGQRLWIPHEPPASAARGNGQSSGSTSASQGFLWPVQGTITSGFGWRYLYGRRDFHDGLDIAVPWGTPVHAAVSGTVIFAGWDGPWGVAVRIQSGNMVTLYAHNARLAVHAGQWVNAGQVIAYAGMTGNATGPHVHFGIYISGEAVNPLRYLP